MLRRAGAVAHERALLALSQFARTVMFVALVASCAGRMPASLPAFVASGSFGEMTRVMMLSPGVTVTLVLPRGFDPHKRVDLILYALPNGNSTAETIGRKTESRIGETTAGWRYDIQHIGAQTRALRARGLNQAVVAYLEADTKSWPDWRRAASASFMVGTHSLSRCELQF